MTAANASISDGAAALVVMRRSRAEQPALHRSLPSSLMPRGRGRPEGSPSLPLTRCESSSTRRAGLPTVDLFEINEAFAVVTIAAIRTLGSTPTT